MNSIKNAPKIRIASPLLAGVLYAFIGLAICALCLSVMLHFGEMKETSLPKFTLIAHALCALLGGLISGRRSRKRGWYHGGLLGAVYGITILVIGFLALDASMSIRGFSTLAITIAVGALGGMIGVNTRQ